MLNSTARLSVIIVLAACVGAPGDSSTGYSFVGSADDQAGDSPDINEWDLLADDSGGFAMYGRDETGALDLTVALTMSGENLLVTVDGLGSLVISPQLEIIEDTLPDSDTEVEDDLFELVSDLGYALDSGDLDSVGVGTVRQALTPDECLLDKALPTYCGSLVKMKWVLYTAAAVVVVIGVKYLIAEFTVATVGGFFVAGFGGFGLASGARLLGNISWCQTQPADAKVSACQ